ncbi:MAG: GNAT family N-acetyltransferase [Myxococcales bacterium]|nr:GNAT family N-acetyltransferase [Myxococcales bacterium]
MRLRLACPDDMPALWRIFSAVVVAGETYVQDETFAEAAFAPYWSGRGGEQWVAELDGAVVGGYTLRANHPGRGSMIGTASYVVDEAHRGRGIGRTLGQHSLDRARTLGFRGMLFNFVVATNAPALHLWESLGFRVIARVPSAFDHERLGPTDALVMFRSLEPTPDHAGQVPPPNGNDQHLRDDALDARTHHAVMRSFLEKGRPPNAAEISQAAAAAPAEVSASLMRLHEGHGLVLHPGSERIWIAHPFSASPTAVWVQAQDRGWWAPCLWCAMGIVTLAGEDSTVHTRLGGERSEARIEVRGGRIVSDDLPVHFAIPVREAWNNVVHWCSTVLPFAQADQISGWCSRHGLPRGEVVPTSQVLALAQVWYGRHLDLDWRKWTLAEAKAIFDQVGLTSDIWALPLSDARF